MGPSGAHRWTDEEHNILIATTNKQLEAEASKRSDTITWTTLWQKISDTLAKSGFDRTPAACGRYWKRTGENQQSAKDAAGPRWDDAEHQILLGMTEDQIQLEEDDLSAVMPWPEHWEKVSKALTREGFTRLPKACEAYWSMVQYDTLMHVERAVESDIPPVDSVHEDNEAAYQTPLPRARSHSIYSDRSSCDTSEALHSRESKTQIKSQKPDRSATKSRRYFRFTDDQRAKLETHVKLHGLILTPQQRWNLCSQLGVEERSLTNWFNNQRAKVKAQKVTGTDMYDKSYGDEDSECNDTIEIVRSDLLPPDDNINIESRKDTNSTKRPRASTGRSEKGSSPHYHRTPKKPRLDDSLIKEVHKQSGATHNGFKPINDDSESSLSPRTLARMSFEVLQGNSNIPVAKSSTPSQAQPEKLQSHGRRTQEVSTSPLQSPRVPPPRSPSAKAKSATPQRTKEKPAITIVDDTDLEEKIRAKKKVQSFQAEIDILDARNVSIRRTLEQLTTDQKIMQEKLDRMQQHKEAEIAQVMREIEARYVMEDTALKARQAGSSTLSSKACDDLRKNEQEIERKKVVLSSYQTIVDYHGGMDDEA